jgi:hypothetical protein
LEEKKQEKIQRIEESLGERKVCLLTQEELLLASQLDQQTSADRKTILKKLHLDTGGLFNDRLADLIIFNQFAFAGQGANHRSWVYVNLPVLTSFLLCREFSTDLSNLISQLKNKLYSAYPACSSSFASSDPPERTIFPF